MAVVFSFCSAPVQATVNWNTLIDHTFDGNAADDLNGSTVDTFNLTTGGSTSRTGQWSASTLYKQDGSAQVGRKAASISFGDYIIDSKGQEDSLFMLSVTVEATPDTHWQSLGFGMLTAPATNQRFQDSGVGVATLLFGDSSTSGSSYVQTFVGNGTAGNATWSQKPTGKRTFTIELDFRDFDGSSNFGTVTWSDSELGTIRTASAYGGSYRSILLTGHDTASAVFDSVTLSQIPEPSMFGMLAVIGGVTLLARRRRLI